MNKHISPETESEQWDSNSKDQNSIQETDQSLAPYTLRTAPLTQSIQRPTPLPDMTRTGWWSN